MRVCLFEDRQVAFLEPLTLTRPAFELRCGALALWQRQQAYFGIGELGALVRPHMADLCRAVHPHLAVNDVDWLRAGPTVLVNARWLPATQPLGDVTTARVALAGDQVAFAVLSALEPAECHPQTFEPYLVRCKETFPHCPAGGSMIDYPWDLVERNAEMLGVDFPDGARKPGWRSDIQGVAVIGPRERLYIHETAAVEPLVAADTTRGPVVIDRDAVVQAFSRLEGPCYVGPGSWLLGGAKFRGSTLGPMCRVGGEVEASIIHGYSNKYHEGFLGHSYVGEWVNLAAGTQISDLRNDYGRVNVTLNGTRTDTGLSKVGSFIGDHTKTGLGALFNTGTVVGAFCNLLPSGELMPRVIPSFCRYARGQLQLRSDWRELLATAAKVMERRGRQLTDAHTNLINALFDQTTAQREQI
jgi:UDP-N-acetylglucosamine diphosphorylase/glucosamine-1-phosphate N-acetyltransferase